MIATADAGNDNQIFVGDKPFMNYVAAIIMQFTTHEQPNVIIKARGKHISRAIDVCEVAVKDFLEGEVDVQKLAADSDVVRNREGKQVRVSNIELVLSRS